MALPAEPALRLCGSFPATVKDQPASQVVPSDDPLFGRFLKGEATAVAQVAALVTRVVGFRGYYIPATERPDVVQEVMLQVWGAVTQAGFSFRSNFEALIRSVAYRKCVDWMRRQRTMAALDAQTIAAAPGPEEDYYEKELSELGRLVLAELRLPCRELFHLHAGEGMTYRKIGEEQERSEGAVRTQMSECLKEAREALGRIRARRSACPSMESVR